MMIKKIYYNKTFRIIFSFFLFSLLSILIMALTGKTTGLGDTYFHWQRITEIKAGIEHFYIPRFALSDFNYSGDAVMTMYPYLTLIPYAIAFMFIKSIIVLFYFMFFLYNFVTMIVAFYSSKRIANNFYTSYVFAILYGMLGNFTLTNNDYGVNIVVVFFPLVIFGLVSFIKDGKWIELSIGMSLILFSNVLAFILTLCFVVLFLIVNCKQINKHNLTNLIKAGSLSLITTAIFWLPFINLITKNKLNIPQIFNIPDNAFVLMTKSINFNSYISGGMSMNFIATFTIFLGLVFYKKMPKFTKQFYLMGTLIFFFYGFSMFWSIVPNGPFAFMKIIQFPTRLYFISQILLDFVFSVIIFELVDYSNKKQIIKSATIVIGIVVLSQMSLQYLYVNQFITNKTDNVVTRENQNIYYHTNYNTNQDYYPKNSLVMYNFILSSSGIYDYNKTIKMQPKGDGEFRFYIPVKNVQELNLPFFFYNGINYDVKMDGKDIAFHSNKTSLLTINNVKKGHHTIKIYVNSDFVIMLSRFLFLISIIIYIDILFRKLKNESKSSSNKEINSEQ